MTNEQQWCQEIYEDLVKNNKRLVLIGGGSSSGKSHNAEVLEGYLTNKGLSVKVFSTDDYYKGLAWVITEHTLNKKEFSKYKPQLKEITKIVREVTEPYIFDDKFIAQNVEALESKLSSIVSNEDMSGFISSLKYEQENMNFDDPFDIDFDWVVDTIQKVNNKEKSTIGAYSFTTSEIDIPKIQKVDGALYDVIIVEGIYILRPEVLDRLDKKAYVSSNIISDSSTRLIRRLIRDILKKRSALTPEQTITGTLKNVMPGFIKDIEPTFETTTYSLTNNFCDYEVGKIDSSCQTKYKVEEDNKRLIEQLIVNNAKLMEEEEIEDIYLQDENLNNRMTVRLRLKGGKLHLLSFKVGDNTQDRHVQHFPLYEYMKDTSQVAEFIALLEKSRFKIANRITKTREHYKTEQFESVKDFKVDYVKDLGTFIEIDDLKDEQMKDFISMLHLDKASNEAYNKMYSEHALVK